MPADKQYAPYPKLACDYLYGGPKGHTCKKVTNTVTLGILATEKKQKEGGGDWDSACQMSTLETQVLWYLSICSNTPSHLSPDPQHLL